MLRTIAMGCLGALTLSLAVVPATANASCAGRKMTGTIVGGVGGALIGNSIARGGGGALIGGLGGAVLGHQIAGGGCERYRARRYRAGRAHYRYARGGPPPRQVLHDQYGNPVAEGPTSTGPGGGYDPAACRTDMQSYYDSRGALVRRPVQVCGR